MEYERSKCSQRRALSVLNANYSNINQSKADLNYPSVSDGKKLFYQNISKNHAANDGTKVGSDTNYEAQKENIIDLSRVKKEPRANIHILERDVEQKRPLTSESTSNEESNTKTQKSFDTSGNSIASEDTDRETLIENLDSKMHWDEDSGDLPPSLTDLIFKPKPNKISRPPNAFMLFAKEHRRQVGIDHPAETNRQISTLLGNMWRDLSSEEKIKYYKEAQALEKLHKETYPSYVYSPSEARMRKQTRTERKMKMRDTPLSSKSSRTTIFDDNRNVSPNNDNQARSVFTPLETNKPLSEKYLNFPLNPFYAPLYFPHPYRGWPTIGNRMPSRNVCMPQCSCPNHGK
ncbi:HMG box domain-containing protein [Trichonephila inaurata madagascariensis]|uniref:Sex-determining region Y protein n=1 Tax=Trichonephila inaurata madagascariensis TaxID=2747483 RepID=A0A8X6YWC2_9ARAC|nr:HMG box domain-containing protein [Trichonephila inaurata madagascariensis]